MIFWGNTNVLFRCVCVCLIFFPLLPAKEYKKCLQSEVKPKKYIYSEGKQVTISIDTSSRISHQISSHICRIFIQEVMGYPLVEIIHHEDNFNINDAVARLGEVLPENTTFPSAMINLEVWVSPDVDTIKLELSNYVKDCGNVALPGGRFGWFIPKEFHVNLKNFYHHWYDDIRDMNWAVLRDPNTASYFDVDESATKMIHDFSLKDPVTQSHFCEHTNCTNGQYIPEHCDGQSCGLLLASSYKSTSFVINHINEMRLLVKVVWLGGNLLEAVEKLTNLYKRTGSSKSIMFISWTPSVLVLDESKFIRVVFTQCQAVNQSRSLESESDNTYCKYEMHRLVKFAWSSIDKFSTPIYETVRNIIFNDGVYTDLLQTYVKSKSRNVEEVACQWMEKQDIRYMFGQTHNKPALIIAGIFPITNSMYIGGAIAKAAKMAVDAVNKDKNILNDYDLQVKITDGQCKTDVVMKRFIDFMLVQDNYNNLIGILGPACSDTVEPLARVTKHYQTMIISYSADGSTFSDREKYPYFFRTIGENRHYRHVYLEFLNRMKWKQVAALTEDGQKYTEYISQMQGLLADNHINFISNIKFSRDKKELVMTTYLEDLRRRRARIIIADVLDEVARLVMCEAYKLKMTAKDGYVWFLPVLNATWFHTDEYNVIQNEKVNCTTLEMIEAISGYFSMHHAYFARDDAIMQENVTVGTWKKNFEHKYSTMSNYAGYAYDAVWTYALAMDKMYNKYPEALSDLHSNKTIRKLVKIIEETDFYGLSGHIKFRGSPSRFSVINIVQWYDNDTHVIGQFNPNLTDDKPEILGGILTLNNSAIKWFTPNHERPDDGSIPEEVCAVEGFARWLNVTCLTAIVIINVIVISAIVICLFAIVFHIKVRYEKKVKNTQDYMKSLGLEVFSTAGIHDLNKWEIAREAVVINRKLGEGAFGTVYGGEVKFNEEGWLPVAVKTLKVGSDAEVKIDFLSEAEVMKRFEHSNIVKLLGVVLKSEPLYTIMEFMLYGDLKTYLLGRRLFVDSEEVSRRRLTQMALDVARGLSYLAEMKYVHRDLASRNCLVDASRTVKIGDFGMTRPMSDNEYYRFNRRGMLPVRWMAPESLKQGIFTTASDVWSYGVVMYEIITFGSFPYKGLTNTEVLHFVGRGHTLEIPDACGPQLVALLRSCWDQDENQRPAAKEIVAYLAENCELLSPCLDDPASSVQPEEQEDIPFPADQFRVAGTSPTTKSPPMANGLGPYNVPEPPKEPRQKSLPENTVNIPLETYCPEEPLLGHAKSMGSLSLVGRYLNMQHTRGGDSGVVHEADDDEEGYVTATSGNGGQVITII